MLLSVKFFAALLVPLKRRSFIKIQGPDTVKFLQGLIPQDVNKLLHDKCKPSNLSNIRMPSLACLFLSSQGRVLIDAILYYISHSQPNEKLTDFFLIEVELAMQNTLLNILNKRKLQSNLHFENASNLYQAVQCLNPESVPNHGTHFQNLLTMASTYRDTPLECMQRLSANAVSDFYFSRDPRCDSLGYRILLCQTDSQSWLDSIHLKPSLSTVPLVSNSNFYTYFRHRLGILEGPDEIKFQAYLPMFLNLDFYNFIATDKGCYVGQELTHRCIHLLPCRKRLVSVQLTLSDKEPYSENREWDAKTSLLLMKAMHSSAVYHKVGSLLSICKDAGVAMFACPDPNLSLKSAHDYYTTLESLRQNHTFYLVQEQDWLDAKAMSDEQRSKQVPVTANMTKARTHSTASVLDDSSGIFSQKMKLQQVFFEPSPCVLSPLQSTPDKQDVS